MQKRIYFLSDFHLGAPDAASSLERERVLVRFLDGIKEEAAEIFLVGDLFDFWYEYRLVVPKGYVRLLGKLAELSDRGITMHFFMGNHDMWVSDYFQKEIGLCAYDRPVLFERQGKKLLIGHGDGLGPGDRGYKRLKKLFRNPLAQWLFGILPPAIGMGLANYFSRKSRAQTGSSEEIFLGSDKEWLIQYATRKQALEPVDYYVFGHRHLPIDLPIEPGARYINLGDWIRYQTYAVLEEGVLHLRAFERSDASIIRS
ncbi:MAG: UDP-2,3-diacylglucosamine diphosphatase [Bacteroidota bacterium]